MSLFKPREEVRQSRKPQQHSTHRSPGNPDLVRFASLHYGDPAVKHPRIFPVVFLAAFVIVAGFLTPLASAQDAPDEITFRINAYSCEKDPGDISPVADNIPDYCDPAAGVAFDVALEDGTSVGACTTAADGMCMLQAPNEATVVVTQDTSTAPVGTTPRENPVTTKVVTEFAGAIFVNLPETTELPDTGVGPLEHTAGMSLFAIVLCAALMSGSAAVLVRRRIR